MKRSTQEEGEEKKEQTWHEKQKKTGMKNKKRKRPREKEKMIKTKI